MSDEAGPYRRVIWQKVSDIGQLVDGDVVRIKGSDLDERYIVRLEKLRGSNGELGARFKDIEDPSVNIHYHMGARSLVAAGVIERRLLSQVSEFDIWATEWKAWAYQGEAWIDVEQENQPVWRPLTERNALPVKEIDENAVLVWRRGQQPESVEEN